jgi:hypothetical protein
MKMRATFAPLARALALGGVACGALGCSASDAAVTAPGATPNDAPPASSPVETPASPAPAAAPTTPSGSSVAGMPGAASAPVALTCLAQLYGGTAVAMKSSPGGWALLLPDGTRLEWDDATAKTYDAKLATPDLQDTLAMPYPLGLIKPVSTLDDDPGRIRSDALFKSTFGATSAAVEAALVPVDFVGQTVQIHARAATALGKVSTHLKQLIAQTPALSAFVTGELGGTFEWRPIANTNRLSAHSYGIAIDIVVSKSNYWEWEKTSATAPLVWKNEIPQAIVDAFEAEGFAWGGRWYHYDTMHFEYRPELFAAACKP